jgi:shikimate dehydrogenase
VVDASSCRLALLGAPVAHSRSPMLHQTWLEKAGINGTYQAIHTEGGPDFSLTATMSRLNLTGVNLTVPLKELALSQVDHLDESARRAGAVNTVVAEGRGLVGYNTDGAGFLWGLQTAVGSLRTGGKVVILGAGGAARGILSAWVEAGLSEVVVLNRTAARTEALLAPYASLKTSVGDLCRADFERLAVGADTVVQTTMGRGIEEVASWSLAPLSTGAVWVDINYWMSDPPQQQAAPTAGVRFVGGGRMLVGQAALSFELFTGVKPDPVSVLNVFS